jgi:hypothetical protein
MSNLNSRIDRLKAMLSLEEKRSALQQQLDALHQQLSNLKDQLFDETSSASTKASAKVQSPVKVKAGKKGRSKRGALKEQILAALSSAGQAGVRVTELAGALGTKAANIHAWFHSTGKRIPGLAKVSGGHYRLKGTAPATKEEAPAPKAATAAPKSSTSAKTKASTKAGSRKSQGQGAKRGELSENIIKALGTAGDKGLKIKDLAEKVGANYRNVSVWFVTTGKKYPKVKKVAPAHFRLAA